jgi:hypothetical protein
MIDYLSGIQAIKSRQCIWSLVGNQAFSVVASIFNGEQITGTLNYYHQGRFCL